jgi:hypothetical protein
MYQEEIQTDPNNFRCLSLTMTISSDMIAVAPPLLTKKQRGRLKKLRKRVQEVKEGCDTSGLTTIDDFQELVELDPSIKIGPSVRLRSKSSYGGAYQRADGVDHRSILCQLLQRANQTKKRLREDLTAPIPPWSTLHNPVATKSLVVIEIQWDTSPESWIELTANLPILNQLIAKKHNKYFAVPVETRWFQGSHPQCISDTLMYIPTSQKILIKDKKNRKRDNKDTTSPLEMLPPLLKALTMNRTQLSKEGYPLADEQKMASDPKSFESLQSMIVDDLFLPKSISAQDAAKIVEKRQVPIQSLNRRTETIDLHPYIQTTPIQGQDPPSVFALDCEMVITSIGQELARVTLIELQDIDAETFKVSHQVILDELVKPNRPVLDYVTGNLHDFGARFLPLTSIFSLTSPS